MPTPSESSFAAVREVLPCALNCEALADGFALHSLNCIHARPVYTERIVAHVVQYLDAQLAQARGELELLREFHSFALKKWSCLGSIGGNEPCRLNDDSDPEVFCMYHYAHEIAAAIRALKP